ncbi:unnamed protein product [Phytophthora fragariaefolia]|uniref:Unnamed protein product n=1 Tax=Phytophthora fragariaefolia TaxID=1490495 RepID=A0A9W6X871_9STRA|nr:unnamed protein product [Phytophthora fragariaefolia]
MSTPTTQAAGTPAASAAANTVVASSATTSRPSASSPVVTSTVSTSSSPKRHRSLGEYNAILHVGSDADMEDGEEDEETSSPRRDEPSVGSRRPRAATTIDRSLTLDRCPTRRVEETPLRLVLVRCALLQCATRGCRLQARSNLASAVPLRRVSMHCTRAVASKTMMSVRSSTLIRRRIKDAITTSDSFMRSDGTGTRKLPVEAECPSGRHSVKAEATTVLAQALRPSAALVVAGFVLSPFPECPASGRSAAPAYRGSEEILSNEYENDPDLGSGSDDQEFAGRSSELTPARLAVGVEAAERRCGSGPSDSVDRLESVERLETTEFAALRQELALLKA